MNPLRLARLLRLGPRGLRRVLPYLAFRKDFFLVVGKHALERPHAPALTDAQGTRSWSQLYRDSLAVAEGLRAKGLGPGSRVAVVAPNRAVWVQVMAGVAELGAVAIPLSPSAPPAKADAQLEQARPDAVIGGPRGLPLDTSWWGASRRRRPRRRRGPDMVLHTSGTSGRSKGAKVSTADARLWTGAQYVEAFDFGPGDTLLTPCPLYHAAPMLLSGLAIVVGAELHVTESMPPVRTLAQATHVFAVPTLLGRLSRDPDVGALRDTRLRALISGGGPCRPELKTRLTRQIGPVVYDFYGATELGVVSVGRPGHPPHSVGRPLSGVALRFEGGPSPTEGELWVRSDAVSSGFEGVADQGLALEGWRTAGDWAALEDGALVLKARRADVVITGGVNVFPGEVERALEAHPAIQQAVVVGLEDPEWGQALHAAVVLEPGHDLPDWKTWTRARLAASHVPKAAAVFDAIPIGSTGKVLRRAVRQRLEQTRATLDP